MRLTRRKFLHTSAALAAAALADSTGKLHAQTAATDASWQSRKLKRKPNVVMVVFDDVGFGDFGCYGSEVPTNCVDTLARNGARYNNFHVTSLCAPTRACLLTGVNAHAAGVGNIAEWGRDHPGYRGWIRDDVNTLAEILKPSGYGTYAVGKWHLSPVTGRNATGPHDQWPTGRGFDHWYGFLGAAADHWHPELFRDRAAVYPDKSDGYHLTEDLVDQSIAYLKDHLAASQQDPYFLYLALGACHFPYHVPPNYMTMHRGRYDAGWDALRTERIARQKSLGIVPENTQLSPRNPDVPAWNSVSADERRFSARTQEAYAAFLHHTDDQLQRLVDFLRREDQLDDTILIVLSDNGAGSWAPPAGRLDVHRVVYIEPESIEELIDNIDKVGGEDSQPSYAPGWAQVSNTPLKLYKGDTFEGGIRAPFIVHWPNGNLPANSIRSQYHHAIDVVPTVLEMANLEQPSLDGISLAYSLDHADAASRKTLQHYETAGDRAIWIDGWKAVTHHRKGDRFEDDEWSLFHAAVDFSEIDDLSSKYPRRVEEMVALWHAEAEAHNVLPLEDDLLSLEYNVAAKPRARYVLYPGNTRIERRSAPDIFAYDYEMTADVELADDRASGVLLASGDSMAGYEFLMRDGYLEFIYVYTRGNHFVVSSRQRVPAGRHALSVRGTKTGDRSGRADLVVNGAKIASIEIPKMWEVKSLNAGVRCGQNRGAPISQSYEGSNKFEQTLLRVTIKLDI